MSGDKPRRLGRGLEALIPGAMTVTTAPAPGATAPPSAEYQKLTIASIRPNPYQPRREFVEADLAELQASLKVSGLLQPITVRPAAGGYELISGERRLRAATRLGWSEIPAIIKDVDDRTLLTLALVENLQRADLNAVEEARGYRRLAEEFGYTHAQIAEAMGKDRTSITSLLRILQLPAAVLETVERGQLSAGHARALVSLEDERKALALANEAIAHQLSVRELERRVRDLLQPPTPPRPTPTTKPGARGATAPVLKRLEDELRRRLQTDVHIRLSGPERGTIDVAFYSADDLERVLDLVLGANREPVMNLKRLTGHAVLLLAAVACGGADRDGAAPDTSFRVALLTPGPISDQSWNGGAYQGLMRIRDSLGAQVSHVQTKTPADFEENFREYGARGFTLVFGHGFEFQDAAKRVAPQYPRTMYVTTSGNTAGANIAGILFSFSDASYLAGILAADVSKSGVLGVIGGTELPPVKESFVAFERGARSVKPGIRVLTAFIGNWDDVSAGKEQALAQIARGADVIFQNADAAGLGVFQAARDRRGVYVIGSNADQNSVAPEVTLGSVVIDLPRAFLDVARQVKQGGFEGKVVTFDAKSDVVRLVLNPGMATTIASTTRQRIDSVSARIHAGAFSSTHP